VHYQRACDKLLEPGHDGELDELAKLHRTFSKEDSKILNEIVQCASRAGEMDGFVQHYGKRFRMAADVLETLARTIWEPSTSTDTFTPLVDEARDRSKKRAAFTEQLSETHEAIRDDESVISDTSQMTHRSRRRWRDKVKSKFGKLKVHRHKNRGKHQQEASLVATNDILAKTGERATSIEQSSTSVSSGPKGGHDETAFSMVTGSLPSPRKNSKKYKDGTDGMIAFMHVATRILYSEMVLAAKVLPRGELGRRIFLDAIPQVTEALMSIGCGVGLMGAMEEYSDMECLFALLDVLGTLQRNLPALEAAVAPGGLTYLRYQQDVGLIESGRRLSTSSPPPSPGGEPLSTLAWEHIQMLQGAWRKESLNAFQRSRSLLIRGPAEVPVNATVHPMSTKLAGFCRRLYEKVDLLTPLMGESRNEEWFSTFLEEIVRDYIQAVGRTNNRDPLAGGAITLFVLNNALFLINKLATEPTFVSALKNSALLARLEQDTDSLKDCFSESVTADLVQVLGSGPHGYESVDDLLRSSMGSSAKKALREYLARVNDSVTQAHQANLQLEVPDFALRTELRLRVRLAVLDMYTRLHDKVSALDLSRSNKGSGDLKVSPNGMSMMISQFFELSETVSNPDAMLPPATSILKAKK